MATMTHRTTFAFDLTTIRRLKNLSSRWHVSQAEVIRRALFEAAKQPITIESNPLELLEALRDSGDLLPKKVADAYLKEIYEDRKNWRG
ncbi:MAG: hypothetical protein ACH346_01045 [Chthoniobacterales bacterium]